MIKFNNLNQDATYLKFKKRHDKSLIANQINIDFTKSKFKWRLPYKVEDSLRNCC